MIQQTNSLETAAATSPPAMRSGIDIAPEPNIKFVGRPEHYDRSKKKLKRPNDPLTRIATGGKTIDLPSKETQLDRRKFYHEDAVLIVQAYPHLYKIIRPRTSEK